MGILSVLVLLVQSHRPKRACHSEIHKKVLASKADLGYNRDRDKNRLKREIRMRPS